MDSHSGRADEPARRRRRTTTLELEILEIEFAKCDKPSISERERERISRTDIDGPGMNSREIQVWFQNKRQAIRRAQGAYPNCEPMSERARARLANEELFGIKLGSLRSDQTTPPNSFTSPEDSGDSSAPRADGTSVLPDLGLATPKSSKMGDRRARLVLSDLGDGHAEIMFSPTPLKPSSPPRVPTLITPMRTPLSRKIAARSASSPALFSSSAVRRLDGLTSALRDRSNVLGGRSVNSPAPEDSLGLLRSLKRPHALMSVGKGTAASDPSQKRRTHVAKSASFHDLGRGKENIPPSPRLDALPLTPAPHRQARTLPSAGPTPDETSYGRDIRRINSENLSQAWNKGPTRSSPSAFEPRLPVARLATVPDLAPLDRSSSRSPIGHGATSTKGASEESAAAVLVPAGRKKLSAEECALSLVSLAHGN